MKGNERKAECKKKKLCCKFEGLTLRTRPQNGITLIALIITIIVMLILVGVTINVALNGGLFTQAQEASKNTQIQADKEQLLSAIVASYDIETRTIRGASELEDNLGDGWTVEEEGSVYKVTSPKGNIFTVDENGNITEGNESGGETGGTEQPAEAWQDNGDGTYTKGDQTVTVGQTTFTNAEVLEKLGITESTGTYTGTWTVIGAEGDKLKLVTTESVGSQTLGYDDPGAIAAIQAKDESSPTDEEKLERAIWSYKNAVDTLKTKAKEATGIESARSINIEDIYDIIGEENVDKGTANGIKWNYYYENGYVYSKYQTGTDESGEIIWSEPEKTGYSSQKFVDDDGNTVVVEADDDDVTLTYTYYAYHLPEEQLKQLGTLSSDYYWLSTTCSACRWNIAWFMVRAIRGDWIWYYELFRGPGARSSKSYYVRSVIYVSGL